MVDDILARRITIPDTVLYQELDSEAVLLSLDKQHYYGLDELGTRVWQLLLEHQSAAPVVAALLDEYEVDEPTLRGDVERLIRELAANGLIEL